MKSITGIFIAIMISTCVLGQVDSAEKKMIPPEYATDTLNEIRQDIDTDTKQPEIAPADKTSVKPGGKSQKNPPGAIVSADGIILRNGKVTITKNGKQNVVTETMLLENGHQIRADGTVMRKDGSTFMLKENVEYDLTGNLREKKSGEIKQSAPESKPSAPPADYNRTPDRKSPTTPERSNDKYIPQQDRGAVPAEQKKPASGDKNMYLVPDSSVKDYNKAAPK